MWFDWNGVDPACSCDWSSRSRATLYSDMGFVSVLFASDEDDG